MVSDFNPDFSFEFGGAEEGPAQAAWEFSSKFSSRLCKPTNFNQFFDLSCLQLFPRAFPEKCYKCRSDRSSFQSDSLLLLQVH